MQPGQHGSTSFALTVHHPELFSMPKAGACAEDIVQTALFYCSNILICSSWSGILPEMCLCLTWVRTEAGVQAGTGHSKMLQDGSFPLLCWASDNAKLVISSSMGRCKGPQECCTSLGLPVGPTGILHPPLYSFSSASFGDPVWACSSFPTTSSSHKRLMV